MSTLTWVAGSGGLLGSRVTESLSRSRGLEVWRPPVGCLSWDQPATVSEQLQLVSRTLIQEALAGGRQGWAVVWCAGAGVVGTSSQALANESAVWERFLQDLGTALDEHGAQALPGRVVLASSAGGVFGAGGQAPFTEESPCQPVSGYGVAKLRQEQALAAWSRQRPSVSTLTVRISNLYGPGRN